MSLAPMKTGPETRGRSRLQPITAAMLPDLAVLLSGERHEEVAATERYLRWLLVDNPLAATAEYHGLCAYDAAGVLSGAILSYPAAFYADDQRLVALGAGGYYVRPDAKGIGFFLFKRHAETRGFAFLFSTTCNAVAEGVWRPQGGVAAPGSDVEYVVPFRLDVLLPAFLDGHGGHGLGAGLAGLVGRCANPVLRGLAWQPRRLSVAPTRDWDKLAALARRHRDPMRVTPERSAASLRWRYGDTAPSGPFDIVLFHDARGEEGWLALGTVVRGRHAQVRGRVVLDAVWPRGVMSPADVLGVAVQTAASTADALYLQPPCGLDVGLGRYAIPWRLPSPRVFVLPARGGAPLATSALDLVPAVGDGAF